MISVDEELAISLMSPVDGCQCNARPVRGEQRSNGVELGAEDAQHDEGEGELAECSAHVGAFEGALSGADFDELRVGDVGGWMRRVEGRVDGRSG